jgi:hypothetical protein
MIPPTCRNRRLFYGAWTKGWVAELATRGGMERPGATKTSDLAAQRPPPSAKPDLTWGTVGMGASGRLQEVGERDNAA